MEKLLEKLLWFLFVVSSSILGSVDLKLLAFVLSLNVLYK